MDNTNAQTDNVSTQNAGAGSAGLVDSPTIDAVTTLAPDPGATVEAPAKTTDAGSVAMNWKSGMSDDIRNSPLGQKFEDTPEGLNEAMKSHANLEKLLGHEKVPIPQGAEDVEGWNRFNKAMGVPDAAEGYGLDDSKLPESMQGITIDKGKFAEVVHANKLTPTQAKGLWESYNAINIDTYTKAQQANQARMTDTVNKLRSEWGDAYDTNVELGQTVINKFSEDPETNDYLTATLSGDPKGIKFLAKLGNEFAEMKVGEFAMKRFSLAPEEAQAEIDKMTNDLIGPYMNTQGKYTEAEHQAAIARRDALQASILRAKG